MNRAQRRLNARRKPGCCLCRKVVTHRELTSYAGVVAHMGCAERRRDEVAKKRVEDLGLQVVSASELLYAGRR